jgi:hypothetical protein
MAAAPTPPRPLGAGPIERGEGRRAQRNGYKPRTQRTRAGTLELRVPQTRDGVFFPSVLERYQRSEGALISALAECYVQGVSTRKVVAICEEGRGPSPQPAATDPPQLTSTGRKLRDAHTVPDQYVGVSGGVFGSHRPICG